MTDYVVTAGQFTSNLGPNDTATIEQTGTSVDIVDGGLELVFGGGLALGNTILDGQLTLSSAGSASGTQVSSGGLETVSSGAATSAETIFAGGSSLLLSGAVASSVTISSGGVEQLAAGAAAYGVNVVRGGRLLGAGTLYSVEDAGTVSGVTVGSSLDVLAGGVADAVTVSGLANPGAYYHMGAFVSSGAFASGVTVDTGGYLELDATGSAANLVVGAGGDVAGNGGGVLKGGTINAGVVSGVTISGALVDRAGGYDWGDVIASGASAVVSVGASTYRDTLEAGAALSGGGVVFALDDLGTVSDVSVGSSLDVSSGGVAVGVQVSGLANAGDYYHMGLFVSAGGAASGAVIGLAGYLELDGDGSATNTVVDAGGYISANTASGVLMGVTSNAGTVSNAIVSGTLIDLAGGDDNADTLVSGSIELLDLGASAYNLAVDKGAVLSGGGVIFNADVFGRAVGVAVGSSLDIESGGVASDVTVGGLANPGAYYHEGLFIHAGGRVSGAVVTSNGYLELDGSGSAIATTISAGALLSGSGGGVLDGATTNAGTVVAVTDSGALTDLSGGVDRNVTIASGGVDVVLSGGAASSVTIDAGGLLSGGGIVYSGADFGTVTELQIGASLDVSSGGVASDVTIAGLANPGNYYHQGLFVSAGAAASGTVVGSNGYLELDSTGSAAGAVVAAGGVVAGGEGGGFLVGRTSNAGVVSNLTIGGSFTDSAGGYELSDTVASGAVDQLLLGGSASVATIDHGGEIVGGGVIYSGEDFGTVSSVQIGGSLDVSSGGVARGVTMIGLANPGAYYHQGLFVSSGASASGTYVGSNGYLELDGSGRAAGTVIASGGFVSANGGALVGLTSNFGVVSNVTVSGELTDYAGASDQGDLIASGGVDDVDSGAAVYRVSVAAGGSVIGGGLVYSGSDLGAVSGVSVGASLDVSSGGLAAGVTISGLANPGAYYHQGLFVSVGGSASGALVGANGYLELDGGVAAATTIGAGGVVDDGGLASGAVVLSGGLLSGTGSARGVIVASSGATVDLGAVVSGGVDDYFAGASESLTVSSGGVLALAGQVLSAGETLQIGRVTATEAVSGVTVLSGATIQLAATLIETGETLQLTSGAVLSGVTLQSGATIGGPGLLEGRISATSGAVLSGAKLASGGEILLSGGAVASGLTVSKGAAVSGPGLLTGHTTDSGVIGGALVGGQLSVASGGQLSGASLLPGANVSVDAGGMLEGVIQLAGPVTLTVQQGATISALSINEFYSSPPQSLTLPGGDTLDLVSGVIAAGAVYTAGRQLSAVTLDKITIDPGAVLALAAPVVLSGGTLDVRSGAAVSGANVSAGGAVVVSSGGVLAAPTLNGRAVFDGGAVLAGTLAGAGEVTVSGGELVISSARTFRGEVLIAAGEAELAGAGGVGAAPIDFVAASASARLVIGAADKPVAGATFASKLLNFSKANDSVLIAGLADVHGAAVAHGSTLVLTDGGKTYDFSLAGKIAAGFAVTASDGGVLITAGPASVSHTAALAQAMATFGGSAQAPGAPTGSGLVSTTSAVVATPHPATKLPQSLP